MCYFCKKFEHYQRDCLIHKAWFKRKDKSSGFICFETNLVEVPYNTWWIDSNYTTYISNTMQRFFMIKSINPNENFVFMRNRVKTLVKAIRTYHLILDTKHHLDLFQTLYVPSIAINLFFLSKLDTNGYSFKCGNGCFSLFKHNHSITQITKTIEMIMFKQTEIFIPKFKRVSSCIKFIQ